MLNLITKVLSILGIFSLSSNGYLIPVEEGPKNMSIKYRVGMLGLEDHPNRKILASNDECGKSANLTATWRISGGVNANLGEFPWHAILYVHSEIDSTRLASRCGGALIGKRWVLTAAHCLRTKIVSVRLAEHDKRTAIDCEPGTDICHFYYVQVWAIKQIPHPDYNSEHRNHDIGLVMLDANVMYQDYLQPVCLPWDDPPNYDYGGNRMTVIGYGLTIPSDNTSSSPILKKVDVPLLPLVWCEFYVPEAEVDIGDDLCAGGAMHDDTCKGDSGSPGMIRTNGKYVEIAVTSYGASMCGERHVPSVYSSVVAHLRWVLDSIDE